MREAMMAAEVGDDVFGEDPTVNALQDRVAALLGKESALFVPSGTMGNEICVKLHTCPGDEIILEDESHIITYETGAPAMLSGVQMKTIRGIHGVFTAYDVEQAIRPDAYYLPRTRLICLENTHGRSAGSVIPVDVIKDISALAARHEIRMHLDGARLWNACAATGFAPAAYAQYFDTVSVCFSKGLGAPVGSMVAGTRALMEQARIYRKIFGGGMRQAGILAAAAMYALDNNIERLKDDHEHARLFASELAGIPSLTIDLNEVQTNMIFIDIAGTGKSQREVLGLLQERGVRLSPERATCIRAVMHLDVARPDVMSAAEVFHSLFA
jgi:threonine aldolase